MKKIAKYISLLSALMLVTVIGAESVSAQKPTIKRRPVVRKKVVKPAEPVYSVATGTIVRVRMDTELNSKTARVGQTFTTTVTEPIYASTGAVVAPVGSKIAGRVASVTPAAKGGKAGQISVDFVKLTLPNGRTRAINGSLTDLVGKTSSDNEGTASGKTMGHRKLIFIGGGAAGGAILGGAIGGGKGALIGGILGGLGGFAGDKLLKGQEAVVESGTELGVYLNQPFSLPKFAEMNSPINP